MQAYARERIVDCDRLIVAAATLPHSGGVCWISSNSDALRPLLPLDYAVVYCGGSCYPESAGCAVLVKPSVVLLLIWSVWDLK